MDVLLVLVTAISCISCFILGFKFGTNEEKEILPKIEMPKKEKKLTLKEREELERVEKIFSNIDNYDGTSANQQEV